MPLPLKLANFRMQSWLSPARGVELGVGVTGLGETSTGVRSMRTGVGVLVSVGVKVTLAMGPTVRSGPRRWTRWG